MSLRDRLWAQIDRRESSECWPWTGHLVRGYGAIKVGGRRGKNRYAHRVVWELTHGPIPRIDGYHGTCVCHSCDNRACCNPAHLWLGTNADNYADSRAKGRSTPQPSPNWSSSHPESRRGENNGNAKLTAGQVLEIRAAVAAEESKSSIARRYRIGRTAVRDIAAGRSWRSVVES